MSVRTDTVLAAILMVAALPPPAMSQSLAGGVEAHLCTMVDPREGPVTLPVVLISKAGESERVLNRWPGAEITRDRGRIVLKNGMDIMHIQDGESVVIFGGAVIQGECRDASSIVRRLVDEIIEAEIAANPDAVVDQARREADMARAEARGALETARAQIMPELETARALNDTLSRQATTLEGQLEHCRAVLAEALSLMPGLASMDSSARSSQIGAVRRSARACLE